MQYYGGYCQDDQEQQECYRGGVFQVLLFEVFFEYEIQYVDGVLQWIVVGYDVWFGEQLEVVGYGDYFDYQQYWVEYWQGDVQELFLV